jgi:fucose permease
LLIVFFVTGSISATWVARLAEIKADLGLAEGDLAIALMVWNAGAILGLQSGAWVVPRLGSRTSLMLSLPAFAISLGLLAVVTNLVMLAAAWFVAGVANGVVDVAMNAQGIELETRVQRPLLSRLHAMHPVGGIAGGAIGALAAWLRIATSTHFAVLALLFLAASLLATRLLLPERAEHPANEDVGGAGSWTGPVLGFGILAFCVTLAEGSMLDWSAIYLREDTGSSAGFAAAGVTAFLIGIAAGRFFGDAFMQRLGPLIAFRLGCLVATISLGIALVSGTTWAGLAGIGCFGLGISYLLPLLLSTAGHRSGGGGGPARVVARVSTLGYLGSFTGPAIVGSIADRVGLPLALAVPLSLVAGAAVFARIGPAGITRHAHGTGHARPA